MKYKFTVDMQVRVWSRSVVSVEAESYEEAVETIKNEVKKCNHNSTLDTDVVEYHNFEYLFDTERIVEDDKNTYCIYNTKDKYPNNIVDSNEER